ncbi:MAG: GNAT family protein [Planifilum fimeticola]
MLSHRIDQNTELKLLERHHAGAIFRLVDANRDHLRPWFFWVDETKTVSDSEHFVQKALEGFARGTEIHLGIWVDGQMAGIVGAHTIDSIKSYAEIGYWLGERFQGRGIVTRTVRTLIDDLLGERGLNRVEIRCAASYRRSQAVAERLGFRREGRLKKAIPIRDGFEDLLLFGMLAEEWRTGKGEGAGR